MNKVLKIFIILLIFVCNISTFVFATENPENINPIDFMEPYENPEYEVEIQDSYKQGDVYIMNNDATVTEKILGDLYVFSDNINISSEEIVGNVFLFGDNITVSGNISGDIYALGDTITINSSLTSAYILANNIEFGDNANIMLDAKILSANNFNLKGTISRNLSVMAKNININSDSSHVLGMVNYIGNLNADENSIAGEITKYELPEIQITNETKEAFSIIGSIFNIIITMAHLITGFFVIILLVILLNNKMKNNNINFNEYVKDFALGLVYLIIGALIILVLACTIIGIPLALLMLALYIVILAIGIPTICVEIANKIFKKEDTSKLAKIGLAFLLLIVFEILRNVIIVGTILRFIAICLGVRLLIKYIFSKKEINEVQVISQDK